MKAVDLGVIFDEEDRDVIESRSWCLNPQGYPITRERIGGRKKTSVGLHRLLLGAPDGMYIDHINRNPLDNRRSNLRVVTPRENALNSRDRTGTSSKYRGVSRRGSKWQVVIRVDGTLKFIGVYETEDEAASAAAPYFDNPTSQPLKYGLGPKD